MTHSAANKLPSRAIELQRIRLLILGCPIYFLGGLLLYFSPYAGAVWLIICFILSAVILLFYIPAYCRSIFFSINGRSLLIRKGVFFRKTIWIVWDRVQYLRTVATPAARCFHTASVLFLMAGQLVWLGELDIEQTHTLQEVFLNEACDAQDASTGNAATS